MSMALFVPTSTSSPRVGPAAADASEMATDPSAARPGLRGFVEALRDAGASGSQRAGADGEGSDQSAPGARGNGSPMPVVMGTASRAHGGRTRRTGGRPGTPHTPDQKATADPGLAAAASALVTPAPHSTDGAGRPSTARPGDAVTGIEVLYGRSAAPETGKAAATAAAVEIAPGLDVPTRASISATAGVPVPPTAAGISGAGPTAPRGASGAGAPGGATTPALDTGLTAFDRTDPHAAVAASAGATPVSASTPPEPGRTARAVGRAAAPSEAPGGGAARAASPPASELASPGSAPLEQDVHAVPADAAESGIAANGGRSTSAVGNRRPAAAVGDLGAATAPHRGLRNPAATAGPSSTPGSATLLDGRSSTDREQAPAPQAADRAPSGLAAVSPGPSAIADPAPGATADSSASGVAAPVTAPTMSGGLALVPPADGASRPGQSQVDAGGAASTSGRSGRNHHADQVQPAEEPPGSANATATAAPSPWATVHTAQPRPATPAPTASAPAEASPGPAAADPAADSVLVRAIAQLRVLGAPPAPGLEVRLRHPDLGDVRMLVAGHDGTSIHAELVVRDQAAAAALSRAVDRSARDGELTGISVAVRADAGGAGPSWSGTSDPGPHGSPPPAPPTTAAVKTAVSRAIRPRAARRLDVRA